MIDNYDSGLINDYGGGNVGWWRDYIRAEVARCNEHWYVYTAGMEDRYDLILAVAKEALENIKCKTLHHDYAINIASEALAKIKEMEK